MKSARGGVLAGLPLMCRCVVGGCVELVTPVGYWLRTLADAQQTASDGVIGPSAPAERCTRPSAAISR